MVSHRKKRTVVTGMAIHCAAGENLEHFWRNICEGPTKIETLVLEGKEARIAPNQALRLNTKQVLGQVLRQALGEKNTEEHLQDYALLVGTNFGDLHVLSTALENGKDTKGSKPTVEHIHQVAAQLAFNHRIGGPILTCSTACSSGNTAIGMGHHLIRSGRAKKVIVCGFDILTQFNYSGLKSCKIMSDDHIRPFSANRSGTIFGEGAGILILENLDNVDLESSSIYGEILGYGYNNNGFHLSAPQQDGSGISQAMKMALNDAELAPNKIQYINAHGTGTTHNDRAESAAIKTIFGEHADNLFISSIKPIVGHTMGAAGTIETIATLLSFKHQLLPPTHHYQLEDPDCSLNYIPNKAISIDHYQYALSNNYGLGGSNSVVVLQAFQQ